VDPDEYVVFDNDLALGTYAVETSPCCVVGQKVAAHRNRDLVTKLNERPPTVTTIKMSGEGNVDTLPLPKKGDTPTAKLLQGVPVNWFHQDPKRC